LLPKRVSDLGRSQVGGKVQRVALQLHQARGGAANAKKKDKVALQPR
jgi:hypothetical protein